MKAQGGKCILLVDDDKALLRTLTDYLSHEGFEVWQARNGKQALACMDERTPDVMVLDIGMPVMSGLEVLRRIQRPDGSMRCPVLVLTARTLMQDFLEGIAVDAFLSKPFSQEALLRTLRQILSAEKRAHARAGRRDHKVLIGESDTLRAETLRKTFKNAGYEPIIVENGPDILEKAAGEMPVAILMNEILPRMNGSVVASISRTMPATRSIPVVLYDESRSGTDFGDHFWNVPEGVVVHEGVDAAELLQVVKKVIKA